MASPPTSQPHHANASPALPPFSRSRPDLCCVPLPKARAFLPCHRRLHSGRFVRVISFRLRAHSRRSGAADEEAAGAVANRLLSDTYRLASMVDSMHKAVNQHSESLMLISGIAWAFLGRHDVVVLWGLFGGTINHVVSKFLKRLINEPRPGVELADCEFDTENLGMPSSHAQSLAFLSVYAVLGGFVGRFECDATSWCKAVLLLSVAVYMAWLRIREGYHTTAQVLAGSVVGTVLAGVWLFLHNTNFIPSFWSKF